MVTKNRCGRNHTGYRFLLVTAVTAAAMIAAVVTFSMMMLTMMVTLDIGIVGQVACNQRLHCGIRIAGDTAVKLPQINTSA